jgi:hypothetical protein
LLWDLSSAYDILDATLLCKKLEIYGFDKLTCIWFKVFLEGRTQKVKIGSKISKAVELTSGVLQ